MVNCPFQRANEHYPYAGFVTRSKCILRPTLQLICDAETKDSCVLWQKMREDLELWEQMQGWTKYLDQPSPASIG